METEVQTKRYVERCKGIEVVKTKYDFYSAIGEAQIHCGVFSTTLFESIGLGIPTLVLNLPGHENCAPLIDNNLVKFAETPSDFVAILNNAFQSETYYEEWQRQTDDERCAFWFNRPTEKMNELLKEAGIA